MKNTVFFLAFALFYFPMICQAQESASPSRVEMELALQKQKVEIEHASAATDDQIKDAQQQLQREVDNIAATRITWPQLIGTCVSLLGLMGALGFGIRQSVLRTATARLQKMVDAKAKKLAPQYFISSFADAADLHKDKIEEIISNHEHEKQLARKSKILVAFSTEPDKFRAKEVLEKIWEFGYVEYVPKQNLKYEATLAFDLTVLWCERTEDSPTSYQDIVDKVKTSEKKSYFFCYTTGNSRVTDPDGKHLGFANMQITLYPRIIEMLRFIERAEAA